MHSFASALEGGEWSASRPGRFTPRERAPGTHWIGGRVGPMLRSLLCLFCAQEIFCGILSDRSHAPHWSATFLLDTFPL
jgi:hypothetical protein